jgi:acetate kinase
MRILTINCGSSTLKFELFEAAAQCLREERTPTPISRCESLVAQATAYSREHLEDMPEIRDWTWTGE